MSVQTITRQDILHRAMEVVRSAPEHKLQQIWDQVNAWAFANSDTEKNFNQRAEPNEIDDEAREFVVSPRPVKSHKIRVPIRVKGSLPKPIMEIGEPDPASSARIDKLQANTEWWNQNYEQIIYDESLHGRFVAISDGEIFSADSYL
ncbi:MAG: hypothetical protein AAF639_42675, partial [Chloroflexota bacterium]